MLSRFAGSLVLLVAFLGAAMPASADAPPVAGAPPSPSPTPSASPAASASPGAAASPAASPTAKPTPTPTPGPPFANMQWREIGPATAGGRVAAVAGTAENAKLYYVGAAGGGVWKIAATAAQTWDAGLR